MIETLMHNFRPVDISDEEYNSFYKSFCKDSEDPMSRTHFVAEGEVTFKSILFVPKAAPHDTFNNYGKKTDSIKMYVRRVFITDNFEEMMPKYLNFVRGLVSTDGFICQVCRIFSHDNYVNNLVVPVCLPVGPLLPWFIGHVTK